MKRSRVDKPFTPPNTSAPKDLGTATYKSKDLFFGLVKRVVQGNEIEVIPVFHYERRYLDDAIVAAPLNKQLISIPVPGEIVFCTRSFLDKTFYVNPVNLDNQTTRNIIESQIFSSSDKSDVQQGANANSRQAYLNSTRGIINYTENSDTGNTIQYPPPSPDVPVMVNKAGDSVQQGRFGNSLIMSSEDVDGTQVPVIYITNRYATTDREDIGPDVNLYGSTITVAGQGIVINGDSPVSDDTIRYSHLFDTSKQDISEYRGDTLDVKSGKLHVRMRDDVILEGGRSVYLVGNEFVGMDTKEGYFYAKKVFTIESNEELKLISNGDNLKVEAPDLQIGDLALIDFLISVLQSLSGVAQGPLSPIQGAIQPSLFRLQRLRTQNRTEASRRSASNSSQ